MDLQHLSKFELRQICYFMTLVQTGNNFSEAAKKVGIKQPPFSQRIQALEKSLSLHKDAPIKLLDRSKYPVELTEAGKVFLKEIQLSLSHLDSAIIQAQRANQGQAGRLCIGIHNSVANTILPDVLQQFRPRFPNVQLNLREVTVPEELRLLKSHQIDVVFHRSDDPFQGNSDLDSIPLFEEKFVLALPESHRLADRSYIPLSALRHEAIILPSLETLPFYQRVITYCKEAGFEPEVVDTIDATGIVTLLSLVRAGIGVGILPGHVQVLHREGLVYRPVEYKALVRYIAVVWRQNELSPTLYNFLDIVQKVVEAR